MDDLQPKYFNSIGVKMDRKTSYRVLIPFFAFALAACHGGPDTERVDEAGETEVRLYEAGPEFTDEMKTKALDMARQVKMARTRLGGKLGVPMGDVKVLRAESVTWRDGSMGCPEKGRSYTQAVVPGALIVLSHGDEEFEYHSGREGDPFYCANPQSPVVMDRVD
jgi:hypothetical protein